MNTTDLLKMCDEALEQHRRIWLPFDDAENISSAKVDWLYREPLLASALKGLLPYVRHIGNCTAGKFDEDNKQMPCSCGLSSTLSALEGQASRG